MRFKTSTDPVPPTLAMEVYSMELYLAKLKGLYTPKQRRSTESTSRYEFASTVSGFGLPRRCQVAVMEAESHQLRQGLAARGSQVKALETRLASTQVELQDAQDKVGHPPHRHWMFSFEEIFQFGCYFSGWGRPWVVKYA